MWVVNTIVQKLLDINSYTHFSIMKKSYLTNEKTWGSEIMILFSVTLDSLDWNPEL